MISLPAGMVVQNFATTDELGYPAGTPAPSTPPPLINDRTGAGRITLPPHVLIERYWGQF
jgi:hypothetical protein